MLALWTVFALVMSAQDIPGGLTAPMVTITLVVGTLAAGYRCGRQLRQNGIVNGALTGGMMYLVLLAISLTVPRNEVGLLALYKCLLMLGGGAIGCILAVNHRSKAKMSHPKRR